MASDLNYVEYVCDQAGLAGRMSFRKMFGEYALYLDGKVVAFVCDNQLYLKPTDAGRALLDRVDARPFYPRGKPHFRLGEEIDDRALLQRLLLTTAQALPMPKAKLPRRTVGKP
ncbi:MAG: TfoX/Sxy family protein [Burkholderiales bacterium]|nr:TfoX/Sxy family protein [Burkholderiales bacterium]